MIDAATAYSTQIFPNGFGDEDLQAIYERDVPDDDSRSFWEAAGSVLTQIIGEEETLSAAQLYYVTKIYPEYVTETEALDQYLADNAGPAQQKGWQDAASHIVEAFDRDHASKALSTPRPRTRGFQEASAVLFVRQTSDPGATVRQPG